MTAKLGIVGWPVGHSRSPLIHNYWLKKYNIDAVYDRAAISPESDFAAAMTRLRDQGWIGANVTVPHKERALAFADSASPQAKRLGAANIISFSDGKTFADNSDGYGFSAALDQALGETSWTNVATCVLGAGGAARAILGALIDAGVPQIYIANRDRARAERLCALGNQSQSKITAIDWTDRERPLPDCSLLVNTTSLGMVGQAELALSLQNYNGVVFDIVYSPLNTGLLNQARAAGLDVVDGLDMLLHQAVPAFELWFGIRPEVDAALRDLLVADIEKEA